MATGKSGTLTFLSSNYNEAWYRGAGIKVDWSETYDISGNYSVVTFSNCRFSNINGWAGTYAEGSMTANGTVIATGTTSNGRWGAYVSNGSPGVYHTCTHVYAGDGTTNWGTNGNATSYSITVPHGTDGKKSIAVSITSIGMLSLCSGNPKYQEIAAQSQTIALTDIPRNYTLSISQGDNSTVTVKRGNTTLTNGATITYGDVLEVTYNASTGYTASATLNNSAISSGATHTVTGNVSVASSATKNSYKLTISQGANSTISVTRSGTALANNATIYYGDVLTISFGAGTGYNVGTHTVNGSAFTSGNTHTVTGAVTVISTATLKTFTLTLSKGANTNLTVTRGSTALSSGATITYGDVLTVTYSAASGYKIGSATLNNGAISSGATHTVTGNVTVATTAVALTYTLTIQQGANSTVTVKRGNTTLSNGATLTYGDVLTITFAADDGYNVDAHLVNGTPHTSGTNYTVEGAVTIISSATTQGYKLTITQGPNSSAIVNRGTQTLANGETVFYGEILTIGFNTAEGYSLSTATVNDTPFTSGSTYTVRGPVTVVSAASKTQYTLTISQGLHTAITVVRDGTALSDGAILTYGDVLTISATIDVGYYFASKTVNGVVFDGPINYTVKGNVAVTTTAVQTPYYLTIDASPNSAVTVTRNGTQLSSGAVLVYGDVLTITFRVTQGYALSISTVNGTPFTSGGTYTVNGDVVVVAGATTIGTLSQPTNVTPDEVNGTGCIDAQQPLVVSWQVNGNVGLSAYQITIYSMDALSTQLYTTGRVVVSPPFWGFDYKGNMQRFATNPIPTSALTSAGIINGREYKLVIRQWWSDTDYIDQATPSAFLTRANPQVSVSYLGATGIIQSFGASYTQNEGVPLGWLRWQIFETNENGKVVYDSGQITATAEIKVNYGGMVPNIPYVIRCTVETINAVRATAQTTYVVRLDDTVLFGGSVVACPLPNNCVRVTWDAQLFADYYIICRREIGQNYIQVLGSVPATNNTELTFYDYGASSRTTYRYSVFPVDAGERIYSPGISAEIMLDFRRWAIIVAAETEPDNFVIQTVHFFRYGKGGVSEGTFSNNNSPAVFQNFTPYPVRQGVSSNYLTGSLSGYIGSIDPNTMEYVDSVQKSNSIFALSISDAPLFLVDPEGHFLRIHTSAPIQMTVQTASLQMQKNMTVPWVEIASTQNAVLIGAAMPLEG